MIQIESFFAPSIGQGGLRISVEAGSVLVNGTSISVPTQNVSLIANSTNYVYLSTSTAAIQSNTPGFPIINCYPIATAITNLNEVAVLTDSRADVTFPGAGSPSTTITGL